ncbi:IS4/IS5 family transposase [Legionella pneumophila]|nr:IS4/IS5 family transposase [Legionella pneumophila]
MIIIGGGVFIKEVLILFRDSKAMPLSKFSRHVKPKEIHLFWKMGCSNFPTLIHAAAKRTYILLLPDGLASNVRAKNLSYWVTNLLDEPAERIAQLYKSRWEIELFFKWIKQRLKIKKFLGKSENAVKIQLITAIIAYLLVFLFKNHYSLSKPMYLLLIWIGFHLDKSLDSKPIRLFLKNQIPKHKNIGLETKT